MKFYCLLGRFPGFYILFLEKRILKTIVDKKVKLRKFWHGVELDLDVTDPTQRKVAFGNFELNERRFLRSFLKDKSLAIDIGANIGLLSLAIIDFLKTGGQLVAYEPIPSNVTQLRKNLQQHHRIRQNSIGFSIVEAGIIGGSLDGNLSLGFPSFHLGKEVPSVSGFYSSSSAENSVVVRAVSINNLLDPLPHVDFIKLDTEGMEEEILTSISEANFKKIECIMFEFTVSNSGSTKEQLSTIKTLRNAGFRVFQPLISTKKNPELLTLTFTQNRVLYRVLLSLFSLVSKKAPLTTVNFVAHKI
jgi:FkbM family methyltransferase